MNLIEVKNPSGTQLSRRFSMISMNKCIFYFTITLITGISAVIASSNTSVSNKDLYENHQSKKEIISEAASPSRVLIPMPLGQIDVASQKVERTRDPFQEPAIIEARNIGILQSALVFQGIAKTGGNLVAMIKTEKGHKVYKVGDDLGNGFIIKEISETEASVDISNGLKNYRLSFKGLYR